MKRKSKEMGMRGEDCGSGKGDNTPCTEGCMHSHKMLLAALESLSHLTNENIQTHRLVLQLSEERSEERRVNH